MKTEQMPKRIAILTPPGMTEVDFQYFWPTKPCPGGEHVVKGTGHDYAEYVRADVVLGDPNEPLADGQLRWVKSSQDGKWIVGAITNYGEGSDFFCNSDRFDGDMPIEDYFKIGPVIRPPADTTN